jgi:hypothetical protein
LGQPDASEFGHGEPAAFLRLLDLARAMGSRFQFFVSNRVLRAFPSTAEAVLNEGHDLDWFCKHPEVAERYENAVSLFDRIGHRPVGLCVRGAWPEQADFPRDLLFLSASAGAAPEGVRLFLVETRTDRDAMRAGTSAHAWTDSIKSQIRDAATRNRALTICVRPQVLAKFDPRLSHIKEILELARAVEMPLISHRQAANPQ